MPCPTGAGLRWFILPRGRFHGVCLNGGGRFKKDQPIPLYNRTPNPKDYPMCRQCEFTLMNTAYYFLHENSVKNDMEKAFIWLTNNPTLLLCDTKQYSKITDWFKEVLVNESGLELFNKLLSDKDLKNKLVCNNSNDFLSLCLYELRKAKQNLRDTLWYKEQNLCPPMTALIKEVLDIHVLKHHYFLQKTFTPRGVHNIYNTWSTLNTKRGDNSSVYSYKLHDFVLTVKD